MSRYRETNVNDILVMSQLMMTFTNDEEGKVQLGYDITGIR